MSDRPSLRADGLDEVWARVSDRLARQGVDNRGRVTLPELSSAARLTLTSLLGRAPGKTVDLAVLELALQRLDLGTDLADAMARLGHAVPGEQARRREARAQASITRYAARNVAAGWPEPWATAWVDEIIGTGTFSTMGPADAERFIGQVRTVLDALDLTAQDPAAELPSQRYTYVPTRLFDDDAELPSQRNTYVPTRFFEDEPSARVDLAARLLGSAHALDTGTRLEAALSRALARVFDASAGASKGAGAFAGASVDAPEPAERRDEDEPPEDEPPANQPDRRALWERAGVHLDLTSAPALTWALPVAADSALAELTAPARGLAVPLHLSQFTLRRHPAEVAAGATILVVENPRIVEAAAQAVSPVAVIATNGNPSTAVRLLLDQLLACGADLRYHGDFDTPGLAICARMADLGLRPWRMTARDYAEALGHAGDQGVELPVEQNPPGPTPWDPALRDLFEQERRIVHEERFLPGLLDV